MTGTPRTALSRHHQASSCALEIGDTVTGIGIPTKPQTTISRSPGIGGRGDDRHCRQTATTTSSGRRCSPSAGTWRRPAGRRARASRPGRPSPRAFPARRSRLSSSAATAAATGGTFDFGTLPFAGPSPVRRAGRPSPAGDSVTSVSTDTRSRSPQPRRESAANVTVDLHV